MKSLSGAALDTITGTRDDAPLEEWLVHLDDYFGTVEDADVLLTEFYNTVQKEDEQVNQFASRLETKRRRFNNLVGHETLGMDSLRERLFHGLHERIRHRIQHRYDDPNHSYTDLLKQARRVEVERPKKEEKKTVKKEASSRTTLADLTMEDFTTALSQAVETTVEARLQGAGWALPRRMAYSSEEEANRSSGRGRGRGRGRGAPRDPPDFTKKPNVQSPDLRCFKCHGFGHTAGQCGSTRPGSRQGNGQPGAAQPPARSDQTTSEPAPEATAEAATTQK